MRLIDPTDSSALDPQATPNLGQVDFLIKTRLDQLHAAIAQLIDGKTSSLQRRLDRLEQFVSEADARTDSHLAAHISFATEHLASLRDDLNQLRSDTRRDIEDGIRSITRKQVAALMRKAEKAEETELPAP